MKLIVPLIVIALGAGAAEKQVAMKDLPPAVQKTIQDQTKGAEIKGITRETEKGKTKGLGDEGRLLRHCSIKKK